MARKLILKNMQLVKIEEIIGKNMKVSKSIKIKYASIPFYFNFLHCCSFFVTNYFFPKFLIKKLLVENCVVEPKKSFLFCSTTRHFYIEIFCFWHPRQEGKERKKGREKGEQVN